MDGLSDSIGSWFSSLGSGFSQGLDNVKNAISGSVESVANGFSTLWQWLKDILDNIKNGFSNLWLWLKDILDNIKNGFSNLWQWLKDILDNIKNGFINIGTFIKDIPQGISDALEILFNKLFIPNKTPIDDIKEKFDTKFPIINQISELVKDLFNYSDTDNMKALTITYKGQTHSIINFEPFLPYLQTIKVIITLVSWLYFVFWLLKFIPKMLGGIN